MRWRPRPAATLDDAVELLHGIGALLMTISARLEQIAELMGGDEHEEPDS